jgi:phosphoesterase RecJ-like protein
MKKKILRQVVESIRKNKKFIITSHRNLEGDALGSELAFFRLLRKIGKEALMVNADPVPYSYSFLPDIEKIAKYKKSLAGLRFDCFVTLDCSGMNRCGEVSNIRINSDTVVNIDHHISNEAFGDVNWVDPKASSCSEMVYGLYKEMRVPFDKSSALQLYTGIMTDTGSFKYVNTTPATFMAAAELTKFNLDINGIYRKVYEDIPFEDIKFLLSVLPAIKRGVNGRIVWFKITKKITPGKLAIDLSEHLLNFGRSIKNVDVVVLFKENLGDNKEVRVNFRSQGRVDVNKIAAFFGGGGHKTASGCTIEGGIDEVIHKVIGKIKSEIK